MVEGLVARGTGVSKRAARNQAAANMLHQLGPEPKVIGTINKKKQQQVQAATGSALLASELSTLIINPKHSDVMLKCPGKTFLCHKVILASRSPFFDKMFTSNNNNSNTYKQQSKLEVKEFTVETMECVLEFLYSGEVKREVGDAVELVKAGVHFQVGFYKVLVCFIQLSRSLVSSIWPSECCPEESGLHKNILNLFHSVHSVSVGRGCEWRQARPSRVMRRRAPWR